MQFADQPLSELATNIPMASALFRRHRLDFCCGGKQTLREACAGKNINIEEIEKELELLKQTHIDDVSDRPLSEMTQFIVTRYHDDLRRRLPELIILAQKVERVHSDHPACPHGLGKLLTEMFTELQGHMMKEENILFPMISRGMGNMAMMPIRVMGAEHEVHGQQLGDLRRVSSDFIPPEGACGTWRTLYNGLDKLEEELMEHIHLENNVVFPRALGGR